MEMIKIGTSKLKVMLTKEDLEEFELAAETLDYSNTETKRMFWDILGRAKHSVGFDTDGERVLLQLYPSRTGGCELFITKLGQLCGSDDKDCVLTEEESILPASERDQSLLTQKSSAFGFEKTEWLLLACRRLLAAGYDRDSAAYVCEGSRLFLFLFGIEPKDLILDQYSFLSEYGRAEDAEFLTPYIEEHGTPLCPHDAVEHLGVL